MQTTEDEARGVLAGQVTDILGRNFGAELMTLFGMISLVEL